MRYSKGVKKKERNRVMKILLVCCAGMSTSMLVQRMDKAVKAKGVDATIDAVPATQVNKVINDFDIVMLGPQVRTQKKSIEELANGKPVVLIDMRDYGMMNGEKILDFAIKTIEESK